MAESRIGRRAKLWLLVLAGTLLLCWPLVIAGRPAYLVDSAEYLQQGKLFRDRVVTRGEARMGRSAPPVARGTGERQEAKGMRAALYGALAYGLRWPDDTLLSLVRVQALLASAFVVLAAALFGVPPARIAALLVLLAAATPLALVAMLAVPDVFAGLVIGIIALLAARRDAMSRRTQMMLVTIATVGVAVHTSHLAVAVAATLAGIAIDATTGHRAGRAARWAWIAAPLLLGGVVTLAANMVGFGTTAWTGKRYPLTLARSIEDGPARRYLRHACTQEHYTVCDVFPGGFPGTIEAIIWGPSGLVARASPEQFARVRDEESTILWRSALDQPWLELKVVGRNLLQQVATFDSEQVQFNQVVTHDTGSGYSLAARERPPSRGLSILDTIAMIVVVLSALALPFVWIASALPARRMLSVVVVGITANAFVCGEFSAVAGRYQARVVWLLPLMIGMVVMARPARRRGRRRCQNRMARSVPLHLGQET